MAKTVLTTPGNALGNEIHDYLLKVIHVPLAWRQNSRSVKLGGHLYKFGYTGCGDILGMMWDGRFFSVEVKSENDQSSQAQIDNAANINANHGIAIIARSLKDVIERLKKEGYPV